MKKKNITLRSLKVSSMLYKALCEMFTREYPEIDNMVTISKIEISANLRECNVFIIPSSSISNHELLASDLNIASHSIRYSLSNYIALRFMPNLYFKLDYDCDSLLKINQFLSKDMN